jgi:hypothetical protein
MVARSTERKGHDTIQESKDAPPLSVSLREKLRRVHINSSLLKFRHSTFHRCGQSGNVALSNDKRETVLIWAKRGGLTPPSMLVRSGIYWAISRELDAG